MKQATATRTDGNLETYANLWTQRLAGENKSTSTLAVYRRAIALLATHLGPVDAEDVTPADLSGFMASLLKSGTSASASTRHRALRAFFKWLKAEGQITDSPMENVKAPREELRIVETPTTDAMDGMLAAVKADGSFDGRRDYAILKVLFETGMRRAECAALTVEDFNASAGQLFVRQGKGKRDRVVGIGAGTALAIQAYLRLRRDHPRAAGDALWLGHRGAVTTSGIGFVVKTRGRAAGLALHPHLIRRARVANLVMRGAGDSSIRAIMGWQAGSKMLERYAGTSTQAHAIEVNKAFTTD
jgi:integrase/recombinase XerC